ncbi:hypothetical protein RVR_10598 [Actinacidiphila reveromycinica]|uniref:Uncharacterized protein n=1 Tax=Actinacidiphila reveromycinica TaxID=659352 RepID=A0A7U3UXF7_9ACTN|nr:hypothetical protein RVR_7734 [Streptomyces sp. SN-593]BBB00652.1 hypothetical protein RVR_10598 [Streptomyces sp. SN-593]
MAGLSPQPQVRAREAANDISPPGLQAIDGGGRGTATGQGPLLLPVPTAAPVPADLARIADRMTSLYGVAIPRRFAAPVALDVLGDLDLPDPTGYVLAALDADPARYRPPLPDADTRAPRAAGDS